MLAIIWALEEWRHFLEGTSQVIDIHTDYKNIEYFMAVRNLNCRQARWSVYLACFDFTLRHVSSKSMGKPDGLSRHSDHGTGKEDKKGVTLLSPEVLMTRTFQTFQMIGEEANFLKEICKANQDR